MRVEFYVAIFSYCCILSLSCRQSRNLLLGRLYKQIADLYLLTGQLQKAGECYRNASEQLKSQKDWLWVGGAHEGLCVTAMMTKECEQVLGQKAQGVEAPTGLARFGRTKVNMSMKKVWIDISCQMCSILT